MVGNVIQIKSGILINVRASVKIKKKHCVCEKDYIWNAATCSCENSKYLASTTYSVIMCDKILDQAKKIPKNFNEKNATCKTKKFYILLAFLLITTTFLIGVSTYCYLKNINQTKTFITI